MRQVPGTSPARLATSFRSSLGGRLAIAVAAALATLICLDGGSAVWTASGPDTFGRPTFLGPLLWLLAPALAVAFATSPRRLVLARRMALVVTGLSLFGGSVAPALPGLALGFCGATLWVAAPWIRLRFLGWASLALLVLCLPACLSSRFPGGVPSWGTALAPHITLALILPGLLPGQLARRAAQIVVAVTAVICLAGLISYPLLAQALELPLTALGATRLRLLGHHPNLVVPGLTLALMLAASLARKPGARWERWALLPLLAALFMLGSRTGWLAVIAGLGILAMLRLFPRRSAVVRGLALTVVVTVLLVPALGLTKGSITQQSSQAVTKAMTFRASMWRLGRANLAAAPWAGHGPGTNFLQNRHVIPGRYDVLPAEDHPHNTVLAVGAAFGWPGLAALVLLLGVTLRKPRHPTLLSDGASAALFVTWAANGIDMGGATATLFPSAAFLLAAIQEAAGRLPRGAGQDAASADEDTQPEDTAHQAAPALRWLCAGVGVLMIAAGLIRAQAMQTLRELSETLSAAPGATLSDADRGELDARAAGLEFWLPGDHRVPLLRSSLAQGDPAVAVAHLTRARELAPDVARLAHLQALMLSRIDLGDPRVVELLDLAERLAPYGPEAWRLHMDRAGITAHNGDAAGAFDELLTAIKLSPSAVSRARYDARRGVLRLDAGRQNGVDIILTDVTSALETAAQQLQSKDPAYATRLKLAITQMLTNLGEERRAEAEIVRLFPDQPLYAHQQRINGALARGDYDTALSLQRSADPYPSLQPTAERLLAQAQASERDDGAYAETLAFALELMPDVLFEKPNVVTLLRARRQWAERLGDSAAMERLDRALGWLDH